jgi:hypothetical protein
VATTGVETFPPIVVFPPGLKYPPFPIDIETGPVAVIVPVLRPPPPPPPPLLVPPEPPPATAKYCTEYEPVPPDILRVPGEVNTYTVFESDAAE